MRRRKTGPPPRPPLLARLLLSRMSIYQAHHTVIEDFEETFLRIAGRRGFFRARRWYTLQVLRSLPGYLRLAVAGGLGFLGNYIKLTLRNLGRRRAYSAINIAGLAVGMAAAILVFLYVRFETSFDRFIPGAERIYRIVDDEFTAAPYLLGERLSESSPDVEDILRFQEVTYWEDLILRAEGKSVLEKNLFAADPSLFRVFSYRFLQGTPEGALPHPGALVLTRSAALRYFGRTDSIGKTVLIREKPFQVTAVIADPPPNTHFHFDMVVSTAAVPRLSVWGDDDRTSWTSSNYYTYVKLRPGADPEAVASLVNTLYRGERKDPPVMHLQPLLDIHLHSHLRFEIEPNGDMTRLRSTSAIGMVILLVALLNFMNLASAFSLHRRREVGLRKVLGARRAQLVRQFIGEATIFAALSVFLALGLTQALMPLFRNLTGSYLAWSLVPWPSLALFLSVSVLAVGAAAGAYPALFASGFQPVRTLRGEKPPAVRRLSLRNLLVGIQFLVSILFVCAALVISSQIRYMKNKNLGLQSERIVVIDLPGEARSSLRAMTAELEKLPGVAAVAASDFLPSTNSQRVGHSWEGRLETEEAYLWKVTVDRGFIPLYGIEMAAGEVFSDRHTPGSAYIVNQTAARKIGEGRVESVVGKILNQSTWISRPGPIVGVAKDFHFRSLHHLIEPMVLFLDEERDIVRPRWNEVVRHKPFHYLSVKIAAGSLAGTLPGISEICRTFIPYAPDSWFFFDEDFGKLYAREQRTADLTLALSLTAVALAAMGLLGLSLFTVERRRKEIGIRRVLGASSPSVLLLFSRDILRIHAAAMAIGFPLAYLVLQRWLQAFAYRVEIGVGIFAAAGGLTAALFFAAGGLNVLRTAAENPGESLRYE